VGAALILADRRTDRQTYRPTDIQMDGYDEGNGRFSRHTDAPKICVNAFRYTIVLLYYV
jgi:hypothetical protein